MAFSMFSQSLSYRDDNESSLLVGTNYGLEGKETLVPRRRIGVAVAYQLDKKSGEEYYWLDFYLRTLNQNFTIDMNSNLLIKTFQDNIIILQETGKEIDKSREKLNPNSTSEFYYYILKPSYKISKEDLQKIMDEGIKKTWFMTTLGYFDFKFEQNTLGQIITEEYNLIHGKSDFSSDF